MVSFWTYGNDANVNGIHVLERSVMEGVEQKFVRIPSESVVLCAESMGLQLRGEVTKMLVEDTSFRVRQIVDVS